MPNSKMKMIWKPVIAICLLLLSCGGSPAASDADNLAAQQAAWKSSIEFETAQSYPEAIAAVLTYVENKGDQFLSAVRLGWLYYASGDYANAEKYYEIASKFSRGSVSPLLGLMKTYQATGDLVKGVRMAKSVLTLDKKNYTASLALAGMYFEAKDYRNAGALYQDLHTAYPEDPAAMSGFAWSLVYTNDKRGALPVFAKLIAISPEYAFGRQGYELCGGR